MPRVPTLDGPRVRSAPLSPPRLARPGPSGLEQLGAGVQQLAGDAARLYEHHRQKAEAASISAGMADLTAAGTEILDHPKTGALRARGEEAIPRGDQALAQLEERVQQIAKERIRSERARPIFLAQARAFLEDNRRRLSAHQAREIQRHQEAAARALEQNTLRQLGVDPEVVVDPKRAEERAHLFGRVEQSLLAQHGTGEAGRAAVATFRTQAHLQVLGALLTAERDDAGNEVAPPKVEAARAYLAEVGEELPRVEREKLQRDIEALAGAAQAERLAVGIIDGARQEGTGWVDAGQALAAIDEVPEGALRDDVRQRVEHRVRLGEAERQREQSAVYQRAFSDYLQSGTLSAVEPRDRQWLIERAPELWDKLRKKARSDVEYYRRQRGGRGGETEEQRQAFVEFLADLVERPEVYEGMTAEDFTAAWGDRLSPAGYKSAGRKLTSFQQRAKNEALVDMREFRLAVDAEAIRQGITTKRDRDLYKSKMGVWLDNWFGTHKTGPTQEDLQKGLDWATQEVKVKGILWDTTKPRYRVQPGEVIVGEEESAPTPVVQTSAPPASARLPAVPPPDQGRATTAAQVPDADRQQIEAALRARGRPVTEAEVLRLYNAVHGAR